LLGLLLPEPGVHGSSQADIEFLSFTVKRQQGSKKVCIGKSLGAATPTARALKDFLRSNQIWCQKWQVYKEHMANEIVKQPVVERLNQTLCSLRSADDDKKDTLKQSFYRDLFAELANLQPPILRPGATTALENAAAEFLREDFVAIRGVDQATDDQVKKLAALKQLCGNLSVPAGKALLVELEGYFSKSQGDVRGQRLEGALASGLSTDAEIEALNIAMKAVQSQKVSQEIVATMFDARSLVWKFLSQVTISGDTVNEPAVMNALSVSSAISDRPEVVAILGGTAKDKSNREGPLAPTAERDLANRKHSHCHCVFVGRPPRTPKPSIIAMQHHHYSIRSLVFEAKGTAIRRDRVARPSC
jgi:hypothetical protein